ncbi:MAG TPA: YsnF/AvaK domain-containing protein [Pyrinomonadaceae bacterium]
MSQKRAKVVTVTDSEGLRGTIDTASPTLNKRDRQALVYMEDGQQLLVPIDELQKQEDGSFTLPFSLRQLASDPQSILAGRAGADGDSLADARLMGDGEEATVVVPVIAETLQVEKRTVESGGVRVRKVVHEREEVVDEPLMHEEVQVKRVAVGRIVDGPVPVRHEGDTMIIPLLEEVLVVEKRLMLKEELHVRKESVETHRPQRVTLRSEEAFVERIGDEKAPGDASGDDDETVLAQSPSE